MKNTNVKRNLTIMCLTVMLFVFLILSIIFTFPAVYLAEATEYGEFTGVGSSPEGNLLYNATNTYNYLTETIKYHFR